jgi:NAD(P)-dependent dehydrogenase (short-subunit alcohol dehydrogenase family)
LEFARQGANVAICDIARAALATVEYPLSSAGELDKVAEEIRSLGVRVLARVCDIRDQQHVDGLIRAAPAQSAAAVLYLASEAARVVTGACLAIDAGLTAT